MKPSTVLSLESKVTSALAVRLCSIRTPASPPQRSIGAELAPANSSASAMLPVLPASALPNDVQAAQ